MISGWTGGSRGQLDFFLHYHASIFDPDVGGRFFLLMWEGVKIFLKGWGGCVCYL